MTFWADDKAANLDSCCIFAHSDNLYSAVQGQHDCNSSRSIVSPGLFVALIQVNPPHPVTVLHLFGSEDRTELGQGVEGDSPVA